MLSDFGAVSALSGVHAVTAPAACRRSRTRAAISKTPTSGVWSAESLKEAKPHSVNARRRVSRCRAEASRWTDTISRD
jgi:hypothetical protein